MLFLINKIVTILNPYSEREDNFFLLLLWHFTTKNITVSSVFKVIFHPSKDFLNIITNSCHLYTTALPKPLTSAAL